MALSINLVLPDWLSIYLSKPRFLETPASRMSLAVELSAQNILKGTGGPFGAVVADADTGEVLGLGVNLVVGSGLTMAHAEMVAISVAQLRLGGAGLGKQGGRRWQLATSAEPCAMCLGGIHWSGLSSVLIGARDEDVRAIGFHEGHKPADWEERWQADGVEVVRDVLRSEAVAVLQTYARIGGVIYNPGTV